MRVLGVVFVCLLTGIGQRPADAQSPMSGAGTLLCSDLAGYEENSLARWQSIGWAYGYMSGLNHLLITEQHRYHDISTIEPQALWAAMHAYCVANSDDILVNSVVPVYNQSPLTDFE